VTASSVNLELHQSISVAALQAAFGSYRELKRFHWDSPLQISFSIDKENPAKTCNLIATLESEAPSIAEGQARKLTI
jgi:hypothetical protein